MRAYSAGYKEHFMTTDYNEMTTAILSGNYVNQGSVGMVFRAQAESTVPLYGAFNPTEVVHYYVVRDKPERHGHSVHKRGFRYRRHSGIRVYDADLWKYPALSRVACRKGQPLHNERDGVGRCGQEWLHRRGGRMLRLAELAKHTNTFVSTFCTIALLRSRKYNYVSHQ